MSARNPRSESGTALVLVVFLSAALMLMSVSLIDLVRGDSSRAAQSVVSDAAFQAAEAGLNDYTSKLLDDNQFYLHDVAVGESTRRSSGGTLVAPGASSPTAWAYGTTWTYPNGKDNWRSLTNGYQSNIQVTAPTITNNWVDIIAGGRKQGTTAPTRVIEEWLRPSSVADFQMISNISVTYGSAATTFGKIYSGRQHHPPGDRVREPLRRGQRQRQPDDDERRPEVQQLEHPNRDQDADQLRELRDLARRHPAGRPVERDLSERCDRRRLAAHLQQRRDGERQEVHQHKPDELHPADLHAVRRVSQGGADERRDLRRAERDDRRRHLELHRPGETGLHRATQPHERGLRPRSGDGCLEQPDHHRRRHRLRDLRRRRRRARADRKRRHDRGRVGAVDTELARRDDLADGPMELGELRR